MMVVYIAIAVLSLLYLLFIYISWNENYWIVQKIPFVEPQKFFGNVGDVLFMRRTIGEVYRDIYRQLDGKPLGGFFKMRQPILMIRDPDLIAEVLQDKFDCFHDNDIQMRRGADPIFKMNPIFAKGVIWATTRSVLRPLQQYELLEGMLQIIKDHCKNMVSYLKQQEVPVDGKELSSKFTSDVIAACALGSDVRSFKKSDDEFRRMSNKLIRKDLKSNTALLCALYAPILGNWLSFRIVPQDVSEYFIKLVSDKCKERVQKGHRKTDFLQHLIDINKESEAKGEGTAYNYKQMTGYCMTIFLDGYMMTVHPLTFCLYEIARNPSVQSKIRAELRAVSSVDDLSNYLIHGFDYLDMVLNECLRLHPPIETITRICTRNTDLSHEGHTYPVAKGTPVTIPIQALHLDPAYYPEPMEFRPERWTKEKRRHPSVYLPFGTGPRECPGYKYARLILKAAIIAILLDFEIAPRGSMKSLEKDPISSLLTEPKGSIFLKFKKLE